METKAEKIVVLSNIILHKAKRIKELKLECGQQAIKICVLNKRIKELEAVLQGMVPFIEDDFPNGTGTNHGTCATDKYQQVCDAVIKAINS